MPSEPQPPVFSESLLAQLACPACHSDLRIDSAGLLCVHCGRTYPILDGIPVLIPNQK